MFGEHTCTLSVVLVHVSPIAARHLSCSKMMTNDDGELPQEVGGECETSAASGESSASSTCKTSTNMMKRRPSRILFGSCNSQNLSQPLWPIIASRNAAAFVWAGDSIYADQFAGLDFSHLPPQAKHVSATPDQLRSYYKQQLSHPEYRKLIESNITIFGTVDDHDYGQNNGDRTYKYRRESGLAHVDFVGEPEDSPIRRRAASGKGVYGVKVFDFVRDIGDELVPDIEAGIDPDVVDKDYYITKGSAEPAYSKRSVAVFVLDVRSNRTPWPKGLGAWFPSNGDMLGENQWNWFESALNRSQASVNIIVSGLQVHADRFPSANVAEEWVKFPKSRQRLYEIILRSGAQSPFLVSGDVHMAQLSRKDCYRRQGTSDIDSIPRPLVELTTSGLTHSWGTCFASSERYHTAWHAPYFHFMSRASMAFNHLDAICPWNELVETPSDSLGTNHLLFENGGAEGAQTGKQFSLELNFGELDFDWQNEVVAMRIFGARGTEQPMLSAKWSFAQLNGDSVTPGSNIGQDDIAKVTSQLSPDDQWICVDYHGVVSSLHYFVSTSMGVTLLFTLILLPNILSILTVLWVVRWILNKLK